MRFSLYILLFLSVAAVGASDPQALRQNAPLFQLAAGPQAVSEDSRQDFPFIRQTGNLQSPQEDDVTLYPATPPLPEGIASVTRLGTTFFGVPSGGGLERQASGVLYRTANFGSDWQVAGIDPKDLYQEPGGPILARVQGGLYRSTDVGKSWIPVSTPGRYIYAFYFGTKSWFLGTQDGFYSSTNYGKTWQQVNAPVAPSYGSDQLSMSAQGDVILVASGAYTRSGERSKTIRFFRSTDAGINWVSLPNLNVGDDTFEFDVFLAGGGMYLAGQSIKGFSLWRFGTDRVWRQVPQPSLIFGTDTFHTLVHSQVSVLLFGNNVAFQLRTNSDTWEQVATPSGEPIAAVGGVDGFMLLTQAGPRFAVWSSLNGTEWGKVFELPLDLLPSRRSWRINQDQDFTRIWYSGETVFVRDALSAWYCRRGSSPVCQSISQILPLNFWKLRATAASLYAIGAVVARSDDNGNTWTPLKPSGNSWAPPSLVSADDIVLITHEYGSEVRVISFDRGSTWQPIDFDREEQPYKLRHLADQLYLVSVKSPKYSASSPPETRSRDMVVIRRSVDRGKHWGVIGELSKIKSFDLRGFDVNEQGRMFLATDRVVWRGDGGGPWRNVTPAEAVTSYVGGIHLDSEGVLFLSTGDGLYTSANDGDSWREVKDSETLTLIDDASFIDYKGRDFLVVNRSLHTARLQLFLAVNKVARSAPLQSPFEIEASANQFGGEVVGLEIPGVSSEEISTRKYGETISFLGPSKAASRLSEGLTEASIHIKKAGREVSERVYIAKEVGRLTLTLRPYENSYAVVVAPTYANSGFEEPKGTLDLAQSIAKELERQHFKVMPFYAENATSRNIDDYIRQTLRKTGSNDRVIFYYIGHGAFHEVGASTSGYLVTFGVNKNDIEQGLPMVRFRDEYPDMIPAKHVLIVIDSCYSGNATTLVTLPSEDDLRTKFLRLKQIEIYTKEPSRNIMTASDKDERAINDSGGIFSKYFLDGIQGKADFDGNGVVTMEELFTWIKPRVQGDASRANQIQTPQWDNMPRKGKGDYIFLYR